jgi:dipeptidase E
MMRRLLLLSNSTNYGEPFLAWPEEDLLTFLKDVHGRLLFIPFAGVTISWDAYYAKVQQRFGEWDLTVRSLHTQQDPLQAIEDASCIIVGGGNTFHLLHHLQKMRVLDAIRHKVSQGTAYIGWSAGSNLACPTIKTTNDMPVIDIDGMDALNLVPFQINPHFTEMTISNHSGESRIARLEEYMQVNPSVEVIGLPEGMLLELNKDGLHIKGEGTASVFRYGRQPKNLESGTRADWLMQVR